ncbi:50S ribosomal protein L25 [bacterium (Candidatus Gribaldobacteria) CG08_land_8_20_14_0_20_39_15]|uniref:Large ribosomal subunit protein bL25 n=1 Tax=bacterium (Candidatus Gribaldobacteria) CG08_land_8_20_14_0_20_39_15 TaxID=2014273 RepID=A0A2M6XU78_9BACT|nr:MAG: 50S ribosomal protein L25 [bacterium (Candidatus Gribaldobacteria) CG08_land_8_20_14_0_20_39_15]
MFSLQSTIRDKKENPAELRKQGILPAVLYGDDLQSAPIEVALKDFQGVFSQAGENSIIKLKVKPAGDKTAAEEEYNVLIHQIARDPVSGEFIHADFYRPSTKKKVVAEIPLTFSGEPLAVKDLGGVLIKEIHTLKVKGLAHELPREIIVNLNSLKDFDARIFIRDLILPQGIEAQRGGNEMVALVVPAKEEKEEVVAPVAAPETTEGAQNKENKSQTKEEKG